MAQANYYIILEVGVNASDDEIKASYRELAKKYHPDRNVGNEAAENYFKEIQQAYAILSDPRKRRDYDLSFFGKTSMQSKSFSGYTTYAGNAYQYAQQEAYYSRKYDGKAPPKQEEKKVKSYEGYYILVSTVVAIILLLFIISYT